MAEIIDFASFAEEPDIDEMDREELQELLARLRAQIEQLTSCFKLWDIWIRCPGF